MENARFTLGMICIVGGVYLLFKCEWGGAIYALGVGSAILGKTIYF